MQAGKQVSEHPSGAKQAGAKITHNTRCHHVRCDYRWWHGLTYKMERAYERYSIACGEATLTV